MNNLKKVCRLVAKFVNEYINRFFINSFQKLSSGKGRMTFLEINWLVLQLVQPIVKTKGKTCWKQVRKTGDMKDTKMRLCRFCWKAKTEKAKQQVLEFVRPLFYPEVAFDFDRKPFMVSGGANTFD